MNLMILKRNYHRDKLNLQTFNREEFNDLIRKIGLTKGALELMVSDLRKKNLM